MLNGIGCLRKLRRTYQLIPKETLFRNRDLPVRFRKKDDPVKVLRSEIKQLKKHEKMFDQYGPLRKLLSTACLALAISVLYSGYKTFLFEGQQ